MLTARGLVLQPRKGRDATPTHTGPKPEASEVGRCLLGVSMSRAEVVPHFVELRWRSWRSLGGDHGFIMTHGTDSLLGDVRVEREAECGQVQVAVDAAELAAGFDHAGGAPAQRHGVKYRV